MAKKKFLEDVKLNPARFYRLPSDVNRDRRLSDEERLDILKAWEREARAHAGEEGDGDEPSRLDQVVHARMEVQKRVPAQDEQGATPNGSEN
ncbi:MAG TPA: hypothetical protein VHL34_02415 [Rhizomicrobium sp.]|jgi:hypothetical protein|nr:hypothetical protein [Rhizomicrobium sp.]